MPKKKLVTLQQITADRPTEDNGRKYIPVLCCSCLVGFLFLVGGGISFYIAYVNADFTSWEPAVCVLQRVELMTTETSWDPLSILDTRRQKIPTTWGFGVIAVVEVSTNQTNRYFIGGGNDCGVFTYSDHCNCALDSLTNESSCYRTRLGGMNWTDCPVDPWCDISQAVVGPCVGQLTDGFNIDGCSAPQQEYGSATGETMVACSNHADIVQNLTKPSRRHYFDCWAAPEDVVPPYIGRIPWTDRGLYLERGKWMGVRFTSPENDDCYLKHQTDTDAYVMLGIAVLAMPIPCCCIFLILNGVCQKKVVPEKEKEKEKGKKTRRVQCCGSSNKSGKKDMQKEDEESLQTKLNRLREAGRTVSRRDDHVREDSEDHIGTNLSTLERGTSSTSSTEEEDVPTTAGPFASSSEWETTDDDDDDDDDNSGGDSGNDCKKLNYDGVKRGTEYIFQEENECTTATDSASNRTENRVEQEQQEKKKRKKKKSIKKKSKKKSNNVKKKKERKKPASDYIQNVPEVRKMTIGSFYDHRTM